MPRITKYPRLRTKVYKGQGGQAYVYYVYDMRGTGKPDVRLGKDYAKDIEQWEQLHNKVPLGMVGSRRGRQKKTRASVKMAGSCHSLSATHSVG